MCNIGPISDALCKLPTPIAEVNLRHQRTILITADSCWEISRPIHYQVRAAGQVVTPKTYISSDYGSDSHAYQVIYAENGALVGVLETTATPPELLIMEDARSGRSWPEDLNREVAGQTSIQEKWRDIFERLQQEHPQLKIPARLQP